MTRLQADRWLRAIEVLLLVGAVCALGWYAAARVAAVRDQAALSRELERAVANVTPAPSERDAPARPRRPAAGSVVGRLEVPRLKISAVAREGADARTLRRAVGHVPSTAWPGQRGNAAFAGHRDSFFRNLRDIRTGDRIVVTTTDGRHEYVVRETRIVKPTEVSVLDPTPEPTLTLVTCYPFSYIGAAPERFIVRAALEGASAN
jgi:sortase A